MFTQKDHALVARLLAASKAGKMEWAPTATSDEFVAALGGKYLVTVKRPLLSDPTPFVLRLETQDGETIHQITSQDYDQIESLYELARRRALRIDDTIDEILNYPDLQN